MRCTTYWVDIIQKFVFLIPKSTRINNYQKYIPWKVVVDTVGADEGTDELWWGTGTLDAPPLHGYVAYRGLYKAAVTACLTLSLLSIE